jgi:hypothetical protein
MNNKPPKAFSSVPPPEPPPPQREEPTEDVMGELDDLASYYKDNQPKTAAEREEARTAYSNALEKFENHEIKHQYDEGRVPTFDSMTRAAEMVSKALIETGDAEAVAIGKLVSGSVNSIKRWSRKYVVAILKFRRSKLAHARMNDEERRASLEQSDADRRRIHNSLLESLSALTMMAEKGREYADYPEQIKEWSPTDEFPRGAADKPLIFSAAALRDRDLIRDWAIVADRVEEITKVLEAA